MERFSDDVLAQTSINLYDNVKVNRERTEAARTAMNQANATFFVGVGIRFDKFTGTGIPVISGAQYLTKEQTIHLLERAIIALTPPPSLPELEKGGEHGAV